MSKNRKKYGHTRYYRFNLNGIDRLVNSEGYTFINSVPCCEMCNMGKGARTSQEFLVKVKQIYNYLHLEEPISIINMARINNANLTIASN